MKKIKENYKFAITIIVFTIFFCGAQVIAHASSETLTGDFKVETDVSDGYIWDNTDNVLKITKEGSYTIEGTMTGHVIVDSAEPVRLVLNGISLKAGAYTQKTVYGTDVMTATGAISIQGNSDCTIVLGKNKNNTIVGKSGTSNQTENSAAISVENTISSTGVKHLASVSVEEEEYGTGILNVTGGTQSAAIGGDINRMSGNITIHGGTIVAKSGQWAAAIGDGDTISAGWDKSSTPYTINGIEVNKKTWAVGATNSHANITIHGGTITTVAKTATPGIGSADDLSQNHNTTGAVEWDGIDILIDGGTVMCVGGSGNASAAIGAGAKTKLSASSVTIHQNGNTKLVALSRPNTGTNFATSNNGDGSVIPSINGASTANIINIKFTEQQKAKEIKLAQILKENNIIQKDESGFPNDVLPALLSEAGITESMVGGISIVLPDGTYEIMAGDTTILPETQVSGGGSIIVNGSKVYEQPSISTPESKVVEINTEGVTFTAEGTAKNGGTLTYQWYTSNDDVNWTLMDNTDKTLTVDAGSSADKKYYRCEVKETFSDDAGTNVLSAISGVATMTVTDKVTYGATIHLKKDNVDWENSNKVIALYQNGSPIITMTNEMAGDYTAKVEKGTYDIYVNGEETKEKIIIEDTAVSQELKYWTVTLTIDGGKVSVGSSAYEGVLAPKVQKFEILDGTAPVFYASTEETNTLKTFTMNATSETTPIAVNQSGRDALLSASGYKADAVTEPMSVTVKFVKLVEVTYNNNGKGTTPESTTRILSGDTIELPKITGVAGYTHTGWNTQADGKGTTYTDATPITADTTLYATWKPHEYHIVFHDGSNTSSQSMTYDQESSLDANSYQKDGYTFAGWTSDNSKTLIYDDVATYKKDTSIDYENKTSVKNLTEQENGTVHLYAVWVKDYQNPTSAVRVHYAYSYLNDNNQLVSDVAGDINVPVTLTLNANGTKKDDSGEISKENFVGNSLDYIGSYTYTWNGNYPAIDENGTLIDYTVNESSIGNFTGNTTGFPSTTDYYFSAAGNEFDATWTVTLDDSWLDAQKQNKDRPRALRIVVEFEDPNDGKDNTWNTITQMSNSYVECVLNDNGTYTGTYPVWKSNTSGNSYEHRIKIIGYTDSENEIHNVENQVANYTLSATGSQATTMMTYNPITENASHDMTYQLKSTMGKVIFKTDDSTETSTYETKGNNIIWPVNPTKEGHVFAGWKKEGSEELYNVPNGTQVNKNIQYTLTDDTVIFVAQYEKDSVGFGEDGMKPDGIPDQYQKKIIFEVEHGTWSDDTKQSQVNYATLKDENGAWNLEGSATVDVPTGMKPDTEYKAGTWNSGIGETITVDNSFAPSTIYTYTFVQKTYPTVIQINKDSKEWTDVEGKTIKLQKGEEAPITLTQNEGLFKADVPTGTYNIIIDDAKTNFTVDISDGASNKGNVDYYTVSMEINTPDGKAGNEASGTLSVGDRTVSIDGTKTDSMVVLSGTELTIKAQAGTNSKISAFSDSLDSTKTGENAIGNGYTTTVNGTINISAEFALTPTFPVVDGPDNVVTTEGQSGSFKVSTKEEALGTYSYQWQIYNKDTGTWEDINGAESAIYEIHNAAVSMNGNQYRCVVTDSYGTISTTSNVATLTVTGGPSVIISGQSTVIKGNKTELTANGVGGIVSTSGDYSYQWYDSQGNEVKGATNQTFTTDVLTEGTKYSVKITDDMQATATDEIEITVNEKVSVTISATDETIEQGGETTLTANPQGGIGPFIYQWYDADDHLISNEASITVSPDKMSSYRVVVTDTKDLTSGLNQETAEATEVIKVTYEGTLHITKDGKAWENSGKSFSLKNGDESFTLEGSGPYRVSGLAAGTYQVLNGTKDTGIVMVIGNEQDNAVNISYHTIALAISNASGGDCIKVDGKKYSVSTDIVVLEGETPAIEVIPGQNRQVKDYKDNSDTARTVQIAQTGYTMKPVEGAVVISVGFEAQSKEQTMNPSDDDKSSSNNTKQDNKTSGSKETTARTKDTTPIESIVMIALLSVTGGVIILRKRCRKL